MTDDDPLAEPEAILEQGGADLAYYRSVVQRFASYGWTGEPLNAVARGLVALDQRRKREGRAL